MTDSKSSFYRKVKGLIQRNKTEEALAELEAFLNENDNDEFGLTLYGSALMRRGNTAKALLAFKRAVVVNPNASNTHSNLAFVAMKSGDVEQAIVSYENATRISPSLYLAWVRLGKLYYEKGNFEAALKAVAKADEVDPMEGEYRRMQTTLQAQEYAETEKIAHSMLAKQPGHPRAIFFLAHLASTVGAHEERADILISGLQHHPANIDLRRALIVAYEEIGKYEAALQHAKMLVKIRPDSVNYWILSRTYGHVGDHEGSLYSAEKASEHLDPGSDKLGEYDLLRGHALKILGKRAESEEAYRASTRNTPNYGAGWWGLADLKTYQFSSEDKQTMEELSENVIADMDQRCQAAFALAKAYENDGDHVQAFHWYQRGNDLRPDLQYSPKKNRQQCELSIREFDADMLTTQADPQPNGPIPIFIIGLPRAGSTLIEQILDSHSEIEGTMELMTLPYVERTVSIRGDRQFEKDYPQSLRDFSKAELCAFGQAYLDESVIYRSEKQFFIDKFPPNFQRIGLIHKILPQAIIIDARRHPLDCGYSAFKQHFAGGHEFSYSLENIGSFYNDYLRLMDHWNDVLPDKIKLVQYEDMVRDTETSVREILAHVGVDFEDACLRFFENRRAVKTASSEQVRQPIYTKSIGRWRTVSEQLKPLVDSLGDETMARFEKYL